MWIDFSTYPMFWICCPIILLCLLGFCRKESLWTILLIPFCLFFATFFALGYYQPMANLLDRILPKYAFYNDLVAFTLIYAAVFAVNIFATHFISRIHIFFPEKVNLFGNISLLAVIFLVFYFCVVPIFFYLIPEAPPRKDFQNLQPMPQFSLYERISRDSLAPIGEHPETDRFNFENYYKAEVGKNSIVYSQVLAVSGSDKAKGDEWQQKNKVSPNVSVKKEAKKK